MSFNEIDVNLDVFNVNLKQPERFTLPHFIGYT